MTAVSAHGAPRHASAEEWFGRDVVTVLGLPFDVIDVAGTVRVLREAVVARRRCFVSTPNLNFAVAAIDDAAFRATVLRSDLNLADGQPIVRVGRWLGAPLPERVAGATVFEALRAHPGPPLRVYLFGGQPGVAEHAARTLNDECARGGGLRCVGHEGSGFGPVESLGNPDTIARINDSGADFVVAALGARKGQAWLERQAPLLHAPILCHLGAVLNFTASTLRRSPEWMQSAGLEWLWRIREEPALWQRYATDAMAAAGVAVGRILPNIGGVGPANEPPALTMRSDGDSSTWHLAGTWRRGELGALREALANVDGTMSRIRLDLSRVCSVDPAFIGLLQITLGRWGPGRVAWFAAGKSSVERAFRRCLVPPCTL